MLLATERKMAGLGKLGAAFGVMVLAAACGRSSTPPTGSDLASDLAAASDTSSLTLAPVAGRTDVISSVEQAPEARRAPRPASSAPTIVHRVQHHTVAPVAAPVRTTQAPVAAATPSPVAEAPQAQQTQQAPAVDAPVSPRPQPVQQEHHGRWKTEAEVIRDAPFPITP